MNYFSITRINQENKNNQRGNRNAELRSRFRKKQETNGEWNEASHEGQRKRKQEDRSEIHYLVSRGGGSEDEALGEVTPGDLSGDLYAAINHLGTGHGQDEGRLFRSPHHSPRTPPWHFKSTQANEEESVRVPCCCPRAIINHHHWWCPRAVPWLKERFSSNQRKLQFSEAYNYDLWWRVETVLPDASGYVGFITLTSFLSRDNKRHPIQEGHVCE